MRRRLGAAAGAGVLVIALVGAVAFAGGGGSSTPATTTTLFTTTTLASVAGQPCVGLQDTLPPGAPSLTIPTGPPPTTLQKIDVKVGDGAEVTQTQRVTVKYVGIACSSGKIFGESYSNPQPFSANLSGGVIPGWQQGIPGMKVGGQRLLGIPPDLGYGSTGNPDIAPDETLWFLIDLVSAQ